MISTFIHSATSLESQIHEEEVRYNEAFRMKAEFHVLKTIQQRIKHLKSLLREQTLETVRQDSISA